MIAYGITHCKKHLCEIPMDTLVCPECKKEREQEKQRIEEEKKLEEFRQIIRQEINSYFSLNDHSSIDYKGYMKTTICCNCGKHFVYNNEDKILIKAPTKNLYYIECPLCKIKTIVK